MGLHYNNEIKAIADVEVSGFHLQLPTISKHIDASHLLSIW